MANYIFPSHYPKDCPPKPHNGKNGTYYRLVINNNKSDPLHFKSYYEGNTKPHLELNKACSRRALSIFKDNEEVINLSKQFKPLGKFIATLDLKGGHGVVHEEPSYAHKTHHNWWVPMGVIAQNFCLKIQGPIY